MRSILTIIFIYIILICCSTDKKENQRAKVVLRAGDFWPERFHLTYLTKFLLDSTRLYGSTLETMDSNYFYCLDLSSGKVLWANPVQSWTTYSPIESDTLIYFSSYLGDIYAFTRQGKQVWTQKLEGSFASHCLNPLNQNLIVKTVENGVFEFEANDGAVKYIGPGRLGITLPVFIKDKMFITGASQDSTQITSNRIICKEGKSEKILWQTSAKEVKRLFANRNYLYFNDSSAHLFCLDGVNFQTIWRSDSIIEVGSFPKIIFRNERIICYGSDIKLINSTNGKVLGTYTYDELKREKMLLPIQREWTLTSPKNQVYQILISNSLLGNDDFDSSYEVEVKKK